MKENVELCILQWSSLLNCIKQMSRLFCILFLIWDDSEAALLSEKQEVWGFLSSRSDIFQFIKQAGWSTQHHCLPVQHLPAFIWSGQAPGLSARAPNYSPCAWVCDVGIFLGMNPKWQMQTYLKPCFLSRIELLQTAVYVCNVCLGFFASRPLEGARSRFAHWQTQAAVGCQQSLWPLRFSAVVAATAPMHSMERGGCAPRCHAPRWGKAISIHSIRLTE